MAAKPYIFRDRPTTGDAKPSIPRSVLTVRQSKNPEHANIQLPSSGKNLILKSTQTPQPACKASTGPKTEGKDVIASSTRLRSFKKPPSTPSQLSSVTHTGVSTRTLRTAALSSTQNDEFSSSGSKSSMPSQQSLLPLPVQVERGRPAITVVDENV